MNFVQKWNRGVDRVAESGRVFFLAVAMLVLAPAVFAQASAPTTAVELAQSVDVSDAQSAGLIIAGILIGVGVILWGARLVMSKFRPKV